MSVEHFERTLDQVTLILFDMDGTLLDLAFDNQFWGEHIPQAWAARHGHSLEQARALLQPRFAAEQGRLSWYSLPFWTDALGLDVAALKHEYRGQIALRPAALHVLDSLRSHGKRLWLVTNAHPLALALKLEQTGLAAYFEHIISSHDLGHAKEQAPFWQALQQRYPFEPARALMIDDSEAVLNAAQQAGLQVLGIQAPDSRLGARQGLYHPALPCWSELLPALAAAPTRPHIEASPPATGQQDYSIEAGRPDADRHGP